MSDRAKSDTLPQPTEDNLVGSVLGKSYRVLERLGEGGMGQVYLVEHLSLRKRFAAKVLSVGMANHPEARARFEMEAHAASKLEHDNIVNVTDFGLAGDGRPYLVMELLKGVTLHERLNQGPISLEEAVGIMVPVCEALACAHDAGIVHRDVKPENIFIVAKSGGRFTVKVLDFGISKFKVDTTRLTQLGQVLGSPIYMAPEMCRGEEVDSRADVYSAGVVLYHMLCGRPPFEDGNMLKLMQQHVSAQVPRPRTIRFDIPEAIEQVIMRALEKNVERRTPTIHALADELISVLPPGADRLLFGPLRTPTGSQSPVSPSGSQAMIAASASGSHPRASTAPTVPSGQISAVATPSASDATGVAPLHQPPRKWTVLAMLGIGVVAGVLGVWLIRGHQEPVQVAPQPAQQPAAAPALSQPPPVSKPAEPPVTKPVEPPVTKPAEPPVTEPAEPTLVAPPPVDPAHKKPGKPGKPRPSKPEKPTTEPTKPPPQQLEIRTTR